MVVVRLTSRAAFTKADVSWDVSSLPLTKLVDEVNLGVPVANVLLTDTSVTTLFNEAPGVTTPPRGSRRRLKRAVAAIARSAITIVTALTAVFAPVTAMMIALPLHGVGNCPLRPLEGPPLPPIGVLASRQRLPPGGIKRRHRQRPTVGTTGRGRINECWRAAPLVLTLPVPVVKTTFVA